MSVVPLHIHVQPAANFTSIQLHNENQKQKHVDECPICLCELDSSSLITSCCNQNFHKTCHDKCILQDPRCPLCRTVIDTIQRPRSLIVDVQQDYSINVDNYIIYNLCNETLQRVKRVAVYTSLICVSLGLAGIMGYVIASRR
jgi:hypothetical protein